MSNHQIINKIIKINNISTLYTTLILLITFCVASPQAMSQNGCNMSKNTNNGLDDTLGYKTTSLIVGSGLGYGTFRDMGTAPISFNGIMLQPHIGIELSGLRKWHTKVESFTAFGIFEDAIKPIMNFGSFDVNNTFRVNVMRCVAKRNPVFLFVGLGMANYLDVTVNPDYENAAAGISEFFGPEISACVLLDLSAKHATNVLKFKKGVHAEMGLTPFAAVLRPGYAYIDNYTASHPVLDALFDNFQWHMKPVAGIYTNIGFDIINGLGSRISLSYIWSYHSSGNNDIWRYDHASHMLFIDFIIPLKNKSVK